MSISRVSSDSRSRSVSQGVRGVCNTAAKLLMYGANASKVSTRSRDTADPGPTPPGIAAPPLPPDGSVRHTGARVRQLRHRRRLSSSRASPAAVALPATLPAPSPLRRLCPDRCPRERAGVPGAADTRHQAGLRGSRPSPAGDPPPPPPPHGESRDPPGSEDPPPAALPLDRPAKGADDPAAPPPASPAAPSSSTRLRSASVTSTAAAGIATVTGSLSSTSASNTDPAP
mmetsp:Transcript_11809/g.46089  ORF Transcript_11809/g.46089 Transcript_11809/m.46089 type:complete len:229 (+) Transcript_11809:299-985(+)